MINTTNHVDMELAELITVVNGLALAALRGDWESFASLKKSSGLTDSELFSGTMSMLLGQVRLACAEKELDPEKYLELAAMELAKMQWDEEVGS